MSYEFDTEKRRREAVATMLHCISEGILEGKWKTYTFKVRQHRKEKRDAITNELRSMGPVRLEISFQMDIDEEVFKADIKARKAEIEEALRIEGATL